MGFDNKRLRDALKDALKEENGDTCSVRVKDLRELLYHLDRVSLELEYLQFSKDEATYEKKYEHDIKEMEEYHDKILSTKEYAIEVLKKAGLLDEEGKIIPEYQL